MILRYLEGFKGIYMDSKGFKRDFKGFLGILSRDLKGFNGILRDLKIC